MNQIPIKLIAASIIPQRQPPHSRQSGQRPKAPSSPNSQPFPQRFQRRHSWIVGGIEIQHDLLAVGGQAGEGLADEKAHDGRMISMDLVDP